MKKLLSKIRSYFPKSFPEPLIKRKDVLFGYYGSNLLQAAETKDHIGVFMESNFDGYELGCAAVLHAKKPTILDVSGGVFGGIPKEYVVKATAREDLRWLLDTYKKAGALQYVKFIYPIDEPNLLVKNEEEFRLGLGIIKEIVKEYPELQGIKFLEIYTTLNGFKMWAREEFDVIGFNDYGKGTKVLYNEQWYELSSKLLPHQSIVLVPGGSYGQEPEPFVNFMHSEPRVSMILAFLWMDATGPEHNSNAPGIRSNSLKFRYIQAGKALLNN